MKQLCATLLIFIVLNGCVEIDGQRGTTTTENGRDIFDRETTTTPEKDSGRRTTTLAAEETSTATNATIAMASETTESSAASTTTTQPTTTTIYVPSSTSYEEAVVVELQTWLSIDVAQAVIADEFAQLFVIYCYNTSCGYIPVNTTIASTARVTVYEVQFLDSAIDYVQQLKSFTLSVIYQKTTFIPDTILANFFKANNESFSGIKVKSSATFESLNPVTTVSPTSSIICEDTSGYIAGIIVLSVVAAALIIAVIYLAIKIRD